MAEQDSERASAVDDAADFLRVELQGGPTPTKDLMAKSEEAGHSWSAVKRARRVLSIKSRKVGATWMCELPHPA